MQQDWVLDKSPTRDLSLHAGDASSVFAHFTNTDTGTTSSDGLLIGLGSSEDLVLNNQESSKNIIFENGGSERLRIASSGELSLGVTANNTGGTGDINMKGNQAIRWMHATDGTQYGDMYVDTSNNVVFRNTSSSTERMRIDASGNVGIGTSSPDKVLIVADNGSNCSITLYKSPDGSLNSDQKVIAMGTGSSANNSGTSGGTEHGIMQMFHNGTEEIRLYTQGNSWVTNNFAIGVAGTSTKFYVYGDTASSYLAIFYHDGNDNNRYGMRIVAGSDTATTGQIWMRFDDGDGHAQGYIQHDSGTVIVGQSDERLKENIIDSPLEGINTLKQIQQRQFNWKKDVNKTKTIGYIAQELETVYPAAVTTVSDESGQGVVAPEDDPDNPYKFVAKERLIDVLIKATQEQQEQIEALQSEINTLKGE